MAIPFNDNIQLNATPSENSHVVTKGYVDSAISQGGGGSSYTLPVASDSTLGGVKINGNGLSIDDTTSVVSVVDRALTTALAPAPSGTVAYGHYFSYEGELYRVKSTTGYMTNQGSSVSGAVTMGFVEKVTVGSELLNHCAYTQGTSSPSAFEHDGTIYYNTTSATLQIKVGGDWRTLSNPANYPIYTAKASATTAAGNAYNITLNPSKVIYPLTVSGAALLVFDAGDLPGTWTSSAEVTFELVIKVTGSSAVNVTWPSNVDWLGDAMPVEGTNVTSSTNGQSTLAHSRTYYFVFRSYDGPPAVWDDGVSETRWIGNLQGSISNSAS